MRVHYYKQYFTGPSAPGSTQPLALARTLGERGHRVDVVACDYNPFTEATEPELHLETATGGQVHVHRRPAPRDLRRNLATRLNAYARFMGQAFACGMELEPPDVVIASIQPLFTGLAALAVARLRRTAVLLEVRDLWPDALEAKGALTGLLPLPLHAMANLLYAQADRIVSVTPGIKRELVGKGIDPRRIDVFPNGFLPELAELPPESRAEVRRRYGWGDDLVAIYTGTHTEVTAIDVIVRAAAHLRDRPGIRFDLFGAGQTKPGAMALARELGLDNIHFHDPVPAREVPALLDAADVALMALFRSPLINIYFQNKFMTYMGMGKPILAAMEGEQADIIRRAHIGQVVDTFDAAGLGELVQKAAEDFAPFAAMGQRGRELAHARLLLPDILQRYADVVEKVAEGRGRELDSWEPIT